MVFYVVCTAVCYAEVRPTHSTSNKMFSSGGRLDKIPFGCIFRLIALLPSGGRFRFRCHISVLFRLPGTQNHFFANVNSTAYRDRNLSTVHVTRARLPCTESIALLSLSMRPHVRRDNIQRVSAVASALRGVLYSVRKRVRLVCSSAHTAKPDCV